MSSIPHIIGQSWGAGAAFDLLERALTSTWSHLPQFTHAVSVKVTGGPQSDLRRCWYLACAAAFGRIRRSPLLQGGSAACEATWDIGSKTAQIELMYQAAKLAYSEDLPRPSETLNDAFSSPGTMVAGMTSIRRAPAPTWKSPLSLIQQGPDQLTIGNGWPGFLMNAGQKNTIVGTAPRLSWVNQSLLIGGKLDVHVTARYVPATTVLREWVTRQTLNFSYPYQVTGSIIDPSSAGTIGTPARGPTLADSTAGAFPPVLPDDGRIITSGEKTSRFVQPPRPHIDGCTRTSVINLVAAALGNPCFLPETPPTTEVPLFSSGVYVAQPGSALGPNTTDLAVNAVKGLPQFQNTKQGSLDGYPRLPNSAHDLRVGPEDF